MQNELNYCTTRNSIVWDKKSEGVADGGYSRSVQQCGVNSLKQKYHKICDDNKMSDNQRQEWEMFELMDHVLGHHFVFNFILLGYPS